MSILVTGGAGFIGGHLLKRLLKDRKKIFCIDKLNYASNYNRIKNLPIIFKKIDLADYTKLYNFFKKYKPKIVFHLAAETHVDNSILNSYPFIQSNITGTVNLLNISKIFKIRKFIHVSTDEVYGSIDKNRFNEKDAYNPKNPYSASKASADHFVMAYKNTFNFPAIITHACNNYGPAQHNEKLIPTAINSLLMKKKIPLYGNGKQIREWIFVEDHCEALIQLSKKGKIGERYNISSNKELSNIKLIKIIIKLMKKKDNQIKFINDRPGHDFRYAISNKKIKKTINWSCKKSLITGLIETINYYESYKNKI
jgi:dTDP-glucose 4,6-dehydratase